MTVKNNQGIKSRKKTVIFLIAIITLAMIIEVMILGYTNKKNAYNTVNVFINQVSKIILDRKATEEEMISSLKDEYIVKAETVAYFLDLKPDMVNDIKELSKLSNFMGIDEIHIFNSKGEIISGTEPKYYGYSFDSGQQMAFFKPMLENKKLSMCQDVEPNTAENKKMMYAITWNEKGDLMIQVGIEPLRLLDELRRNEIPEVIDNIPVYEGMNTYVADPETKVIYGSNDKNAIGRTLDDINLVFSSELGRDEIISKSITLDGYRHYCQFRLVDKYIVAVTYTTEINVYNFLISLVIEFVYLLIAGLVISVLINKFFKVNDENNTQLSILASMSDIYYSMHYIDLRNNTSREYNARNEVRALVNKDDGADEMMRKVISLVTEDEYRDAALEFTDIRTIADRMKGKKMISQEFVGKRLGWFVASFIAIETGEDEKPDKVMFVTRDINDLKKKEEILITRSNTDELTGIYNRRAYEDDITGYGDIAVNSDFVYISIDVNELKLVNDTLGHAAGDELLTGATNCMKKILEPYGRLYRTGGDEFVAILFADSEKLRFILDEFDECIKSWSGELVDSLTISYGYVLKNEVQTNSIQEIAILADKRMYDSKEAFYHRKGVDRRGQQEAHTALCALYTKILKINLTDDSYQIINMDTSEQTPDKGFTDTISGWLSSFGTTSQVHPEDLEEYFSKTNIEYMKSYFRRNRMPLNVFYRRKFINGYKKVMMQIIPASDYSNDNQSLFLYVKNIDK